MVFSSSLFLLLFFPVFFLGYYVVPYRFKNGWALIGSLFFYAWGAPLFVFALVASVGADYALVRLFAHSKYRKKALWLGVVFNTALLAYFKYANFFIENANSFLATSGFEAIGWTKVILPIGISFFTFQKISYLLDVYRGVKKPLQKFADHLLYVVLFPQLIAGPIVRFNDIADELTHRKDNLTIDNRISGLFRFAIGLAKKVLIANVVGEEADRIFDLPEQHLGSYEAWYGVLCYTFQIYFDFSGYSDMAIGMGKMMGFRFPENFNSPYVSRSITEFWRRWHITLSTWMRDYLYIPLGGNRVSTGRLYVNLWLVFLISGLWHGANWTFVIWGAYHGFFLVAERLFLKKVYSFLPGFLQMGITFLWVILGWVFFRSQNLEQAWGFFTTMFSFTGTGFEVKTEVWSTLVVAVLFSFAAVSKKVEGWQETTYFKRPFSSWAYLIVAAFLILTSLGSITASGFNPFIYFRF